jgi:hypothetical protein
VFRLFGRRPVRCRICDHLFWRFRPSTKPATQVTAQRLTADTPTPLPGDLKPVPVTTQG